MAVYIPLTTRLRQQGGPPETTAAQFKTADDEAVRAALADDRVVAADVVAAIGARANTAAETEWVVRRLHWLYATRAYNATDETAALLAFFFEVPAFVEAPARADSRALGALGWGVEVAGSLAAGDLAAGASEDAVYSLAGVHCTLVNAVAAAAAANGGRADATRLGRWAGAALADVFGEATRTQAARLRGVYAASDARRFSLPLQLLKIVEVQDAAEAARRYREVLAEVAVPAVRGVGL